MFTTNIHADEFIARKYQGGFTTVDMLDGTSSKAAVFLETREKCDELIAAVSAAKSMLPSEPVPPTAEDDAGRAIADVSTETGLCGWQSGDHVHYAHAGCPGAELDARDAR